MAANETNERRETVEASHLAAVVKEEGSREDSRPSSPDPICPICLDTVSDAAYTDMCCHRFCFHCLVSWSRVKPECPLCKQRFSLIIHNVRSMADYDQLPVAWPEPPPPTLDANFFISVAFQRPRFRYRTTNGGWGWRFHEVLPGPSAGVGSRPLSPNPLLSSSTVPSSLSNSSLLSNSLTSPPVSSSSFPPPPASYVGNTIATEWRRRRQVSAVEFRRNVYRQNQWVCPTQSRPGVPLRIRDSSPSFYRNNLAQVHRLIPWLHRELLVLLDVRYDYQEVCQRILHSITNIPIRSPRFQVILWPYLRERTGHFCHEFYHFATSPYDMHAYDLRAEYVRRDPDHIEPAASDQENSLSDSSDIELIEPERRDDELIEISDEEVIPVEIGGESDASVEIISTLPPLADREPEVIDLVDSGSDVEIEHISTDRAGQLEGRMDRGEERLRNKYRPYYKDESSTSEEEVQWRRQLRKKKRKSKPLKKRRRIIDYSSTSSRSEGAEVDPPHQPNPDSDISSRDTSKENHRLDSNSSTTSPSRRLRQKTGEVNSTSSNSHRGSPMNERHKKSSPSCSKSRDKTEPPNSECSISPLLSPGPYKCDLSFSPLSNNTENSVEQLFKTDQFDPNPREQGDLGFSISQSHWSCDMNFDRRGEPDSQTMIDPVMMDMPLYHTSLDVVHSEEASPLPSSRPRLKSVVRKVERTEEAGCSNWHSHNLRQRKCTRYAFTPYFSTTDSDS